MRLFIAVLIQPTPPLKRVLAALDEIGSPVRPVPAENLHVTLQFLGQVGDDRLEAIRGAMRHAAGVVEPIEMALQGVGAFPSPRRPSTIWAGCEPAQPLHTLAQSLREPLRAAGLSLEDRAFRPHVTLARIKRGGPPQALSQWLAEHEGEGLGWQRAERIDLVQSRLDRGGPTYQSIGHERLGQ